MKKAFPIALMIAGLVFAVAGGYTISRGFDAKHQVKSELVSQQITIPQRVNATTGKVDTAVPAKWSGKPVNSADSAMAMQKIIEHHALAATGGKTYSQLAQNDPTRNTAFQADTLRTSLMTSAMAFNVGDLVIGLGLMILVVGLALGGLGVALGALAIPALGRKVHVEPLVAEHPWPATA